MGCVVLQFRVWECIGPQYRAVKYAAKLALVSDHFLVFSIPGQSQGQLVYLPGKRSQDSSSLVNKQVEPGGDLQTSS